MSSRIPDDLSQNSPCSSWKSLARNFDWGLQDGLPRTGRPHTTAQQPISNQRSWKLSTEQPRLRDDGSQILLISHLLATQAALPAPPPSTIGNSRGPPRPNSPQSAFGAVRSRRSQSILRPRPRATHGAKKRHPKSVGQLRRLDHSDQAFDQIFSEVIFVQLHLQWRS